MRLRGRNVGPWVLIGPVLPLFLAFFAVPVGILLISSLQRIDPTTSAVIERFTLYNYERFLLDSFYLGALLTTLKISLIVTVACLLTGYPIATFMTKTSPRERSLFLLFVISPLLVSLVIRNLGWLIILGPKGILNTALVAVGLTNSPVPLMHTQTAVVIGLAHVFYPFMVLAILSSLQRIDPAVIRAAQNLGATPFRTFWHVTLPLSVPGVIAGTLIVFALSMSSFVTPGLLGGPWVKVMAFLAWEQAVLVLDWPFAAAISVILLAVTGLIMLVSNRLVERGLFVGVFQ
jgi:putative spermidine/putrescine transport system permease protein